MTRDIFNEVCSIHYAIEQLNDKQQKLFGLHSQIVEILKGNIQIPEDDIYSVFRGLDKLSGYLKTEVEKLNKQIDEL